ncbi:MAG: LuxR C-terminal-related transcriptional regulator [Cyanobacteriota bacterium]
MDLTPQLPLMRANHRRAWDLFQDDRLVLGLGCRALIAAIASQRPPEQVVGAATTEREILRVVARERPDLVMVSDPLEEGSGVSLVTALKQQWPNLRVLLLVMGPPRSQRLQICLDALKDGVAVVSDRLIGDGSGMAALQSLRVGGRFLDPTIANPGLEVPQLSQREKEVLRWLVAGNSNGQIASRLLVSPETVKSHVSNLLGKLGVPNRQQAALLAVRLDLVES